MESEGKTDHLGGGVRAPCGASTRLQRCRAEGGAGGVLALRQTCPPPPTFFGTVDSTGSLSPVFLELLIVRELRMRFSDLLIVRGIGRWACAMLCSLWNAPEWGTDKRDRNISWRIEAPERGVAFEWCLLFILYFSMGVKRRRFLAAGHSRSSPQILAVIHLSGGGRLLG